MTVSRATANAIPSAWRTLAARLPVCVLLSTLAACAGGISVPNLTPPAASAEPTPAPAAPASAVAAAPAAQPAKPAPPPPPQKLTATEINEACWMDSAINKVPDLDKRLKLVDKCVDQKTKAQGGL
ncbi:MAG TPA: hypothetical protein VLX44_16640 [Xanthobacteraceae bacterium]|nr:hypothetical protein [Xanthobacteraceae bacterium]